MLVGDVDDNLRLVTGRHEGPSGGQTLSKLQILEKEMTARSSVMELAPDTKIFEKVQALSSMTFIEKGFKQTFVTQMTEASKSVIDFYSVQKLSTDSTPHLTSASARVISN